MRTVVISITVITAAIAGLFLVMVGWPWGGSDVVPGLSPETIKSLRIGMTPAEVRQQVGTPYSIEIDHTGAEIWFLSRPVPRVRTYNLAYLIVRSTGLEGVYVEKMVFWGSDEEPIDMLSLNGFYESTELNEIGWSSNEAPPYLRRSGGPRTIPH